MTAHSLPTPAASPAASSSWRPSARAVLARAAVIAVVGAVTVVGVDAMAPTEDANIGAGLLALGLAVLLSVVWGVVDGRRHARGAQPYVLWLAVAVVAMVLTGVVGSLLATVALDQVPVDDLPGLLLMSLTAGAGAVPFVFAPAAVGVALGQVTRRSRSAG